MKDNIHLHGHVFSGYLIKIESHTHSGIVLATAEMADNPQEYTNDMLQSVGTILHGRDSIGSQLAFRYDVVEHGGIEDGIRKFKQRVLVDGEIMWEVKPAQVIGIKQKDGWHSSGRHIVMKQVKKPPIFTSKWLITPDAEDLPDPYEKDKYEVAWANKFLPVGTIIGVLPDFVANIQVDKEMLFYIPEEYVVLVYNEETHAAA